MNQESSCDLSHLDIPLERDGFMRNLLRHLSGSLEEIVGIKEASGFISMVGQQMGDEINQTYCKALQVDKLDKHQLALVLTDLKQRIQGNFSIESVTDDKIVLVTTSCPFADKVIERNSLCMMTSNVFGTIAAENLGYAKVELDKTIAKGDNGCRVVVYIRPTDEAESAMGHEYYQSGQ